MLNNMKIYLITMLRIAKVKFFSFNKKIILKKK